MSRLYSSSGPGCQHHPELVQLGDWYRNSKKFALATAVRTWGSSPRPEGSHLVVNENGSFVGSVSGGCIEGAVISQALDVIESGKPVLMEFGVSDEQAWEVGLSCGGSVQVFVESMIAKGPLLLRLLRHTEEKRPVALVSRLTDGRQCLVYKDFLWGGLDLLPVEQTQVRSLLSAGRNTILPASDGDLFVRSYVPPFRLMIIGAVHIAQVLAPMATEIGFDVTVIDPRSAFAQKERFPGVKMCIGWPDEVLNDLQLDEQTALVTLTHDPKIDDPALVCALQSPAFYIGALGSKRTHSGRVERLKVLGVDDHVDRICVPVGVSLGGRLPSEIAVSILAQLVQVRYREE